MARPKDPTRARRGTGHRPQPGEAPKARAVPAVEILPAISEQMRAAGYDPDRALIPDDLPPEVAALWQIVIDELQPKGLRPADYEALRQMCWAAARARECSALIAQMGLVVESANGGYATNPLLKEERQYSATYLRIAEQYGLTVASRLRLGLLQISGQSMLEKLDAGLDT